MENGVVYEGYVARAASEAAIDNANLAAVTLTCFADDAVIGLNDHDAFVLPALTDADPGVTLILPATIPADHALENAGPATAGGHADVFLTLMADDMPALVHDLEAPWTRPHLYDQWA